MSPVHHMIVPSLILTGALASAAFAAPTDSPDLVDSSTMTGKVMCGYQGWFNADGDGADRGWRHWGRGKVEPGACTVDLWPDMTEYPPDDHYATGFKNADGSPAAVFSSYNPATVDLHFQWMRDYGIDGVFLQRFAGEVANPAGRAHFDAVLGYARQDAEKYGRVYGVMYDLSGVKTGGIGAIVDDWKSLVDRTRLTRDDRYVRQNGKPVVVLWGIGFDDGRDTLLDDGLELIDFLKSDPVYGGNTVMIGVPPEWRTQDTPKAPNAKMLAAARAADIICPWAVGRCSTPEAAVTVAENFWKPDIAWCRDHNVQYMPVVFPGFSWHNLFKGERPVDQIPRLGGRFLWTQYVAAKESGATMVYQAMFDEVDEGTAIFKCTNTPPDGESKSAFATYDGLPSDFYLRLVGEATRMIRGEIGPGNEQLIGRYGQKP